jgi:hypothetical protein
MSPPLTNPRHELFAQGVVRGLTVTEAYAEAGYRKDGGNSSRLLSSAVIQSRVKEIKEENNQMCLISRERALAYLTQVVMTPAGEVSPASPLCQAYTETASDSGPAVKVKMPDKLRALQLIGKWCGWETGNQAEQESARALGGIAEMLARIRGRGFASRSPRVVAAVHS